MTFLTICHMPVLTKNFEGLRNHALLSMFVSEPIDKATLQCRSWLVHVVVKGARHYNDARKLVQDQIEEPNRPASALMAGAQFPLFDFSFAMEDCITSFYKAHHCLQAVAKYEAREDHGSDFLKKAKKKLADMRSQQEHMSGQIASAEVGSGPILTTLDETGEGLRLRRVSLRFDDLVALMDDAFDRVAAMLPGFDRLSPVQPAGTVQISMTATIEVFEGGDPVIGT